MEDFLCALSWALNNTVLNCSCIHLYMDFFFSSCSEYCSTTPSMLVEPANKYTEGLCKLYVDFHLCKGSVPLTPPALFRGQQYLFAFSPRRVHSFYQILNRWLCPPFRSVGLVLSWLLFPICPWLSLN